MDPSPDERRLAEAMDRSPALAAMMAAKREDHGPRYRRLGALLGALALAIVVAFVALRATQKLPPTKKFEPAGEIDRSVYLPPIKTERAPGGEEVSPFDGFAVSIETEPPGAMVSIAGKERGEAPVLANVECKGQEPVFIVARKEGFQPSRRELPCRADQLVKLKLVLAR
jgi:hypothetical protein